MIDTVREQVYISDLDKEARDWNWNNDVYARSKEKVC